MWNPQDEHDEKHLLFHLDFYNNVFEKCKEDLSFANQNSSKDSIFQQFKWEKFSDNTYIESDYVGQAKNYSSNKNYQEALNWFNKKVLKKYSRIENQSHNEFYYVIENDIVWVGEIDG
jgi:hypothetical protein